MCFEEDVLVQNFDNKPNLAANYETSHNLRARFLLYEFTSPKIDIEELAYTAINLSGMERIVDVGTANGSFLQLLKLEFGHSGKLTGIEPHSIKNDVSQYEINFNDMSGWLAKPGGLTEDNYQTLQKYLNLSIGTDISSPNSIEMLEGDANNIPMGDNSADVLSAMFMLYHIPQSQLPAALVEFKRVLTRDGIFIAATSGKNNKFTHRAMERLIADNLSVNPPPVMNSSFTTETAEILISQNFRYVYEYRQDSHILINDDFRKACYLNSLRSLHNQFNPVPSQSSFEEVLNNIVEPTIENAILRQRVFTDKVERSLFIASDKQLDLINEDFKRV